MKFIVQDKGTTGHGIHQVHISSFGASGVEFIVEVQSYIEKGWFQRCACYASRAYDRQSRKGKGYDIAPVYLIGFMGVLVPHPCPELWRDRYISEYTKKT